MGFRIERHTVKFDNYKTAVTIATALWAQWLRHNAVFQHAGFRLADDHRRSLPRVAASCADGMHRGANGACAVILPLPKSDYCSACLGFAGRTHIDIPLVDAPAITEFRIQRDTVKFTNYTGAATITTALWASVAAPQRCLLTRWFLPSR
ncbi:hypothetical protein MRX96_033962 [Rhipicephalus microplus]